MRWSLEGLARRLLIYLIQQVLLRQDLSGFGSGEGGVSTSTRHRLDSMLVVTLGGLDSYL